MSNNSSALIKDISESINSIDNNDRDRKDEIYNLLARFYRYRCEIYIGDILIDIETLQREIKSIQSSYKSVEEVGI